MKVERHRLNVESREPRVEGRAFGFARTGVGLICSLAVLVCSVGHSETILNSKHNLSASGPGTVKASTETEVCIFCHTPHRATGEQPLWNHAGSSATYIPYSSATLKATVGQPTGASKLCLSCHDGTVALGLVNSRSSQIQMQNGVTTMPSGPSNLGTDLSHTHPVSFVYDSALVAANGQLKEPSILTDRVRLDKSGQLQCTACHDPHNDQYGKFLVMDNTSSALCTACHLDTTSSGSPHNLARASLAGAATTLMLSKKPGAATGNACENCHTSHAAGSKERLLVQEREEQTCFTCHNGTVLPKNIAAEFNKLSAHPVLQTSTLHNSAEDAVSSSRHVACSDCHNPHETAGTRALAPNVRGPIAKVAGVSASGAPVRRITREYELCFRCHGDNVDRGSARVNRQSLQTNQRLEFNPSNQSFHPVESVGRNPNVPSLIAPWTASSLMYCTDCHNNDQARGAGGTGPNGPHGSAFAPLLERQLIFTDFGVENTSSYALCYKCHSRASILADQSFKYHRKHVVDDKTACTTCHDSHASANAPHLINFNRNYVSASSNGRLEYTSTGPLSGNCTLSCHGKDHQNVSYSPTDIPQLPSPALPNLRRR